MPPQGSPKVLVFDIETAPIIGHVWTLWENNVSLNQIVKDWHLLSVAAKWLDSKEVLYKDQRKEADISDDKKLCLWIWKLLDQADVVITQNGRSFDQKKLNARFILNGMKPPSPYRHIDTKLIASKHFAFTSNKLEYMSAKLNKKYKKLKHEKFGGHELWVKCLAGNMSAWRVMEKYNKYDVLATEELYKKLIPWDNTVDFNVYREGEVNSCGCGKGRIQKRGFYWTDTAKYQTYKCTGCGKCTRSKVNLLSKEKKKSLRTKVSR